MGLLDRARFWNTTARERVADYPAHRHATAPYQILVRAVDIDAAPAVVFRWLCQMKVAPYSYDWIDNLGRRSPRDLTPGADRLTVGERLMIFRLVEFEPDRMITMVSDATATRIFGAISLSYQVEPVGAGCRLVACLDVTARSRAGRLRADLLTIGDLVMMRKQLLTFKALAERPAVAA